MKKEKSLVSIVVGSDSDLSIVQESAKILDTFGIPHEVKILSAHRTPDPLREYMSTAERRGIKIFIAAAGAAAHLAGAIAAHTMLPVIGVPIPSSNLLGLDSLLATVQMPKGIPVLTTAIGKAGAANAAIAAVQILSLNDKSLKRKLNRYRRTMVHTIERNNQILSEKGIYDYGKA